MKTVFTTLAFIGMVAAQLDGLPSCATACVTKFTQGSNIGGCPQIDAKCICSQSTFLSDISCCLASACNAADQQTAINFAVSFCATQDVTVPTAISCSTTAAPTVANSTGIITSTPTFTSTTPASTTTTASRNVGPQGQTGSGMAGLGGLLAALALL